MNSNLSYIIVATDVFSMLMLAIIGFGIGLEKNKSKRNIAFIECLVCCIASLTCEVFNYTLEGNPVNTIFLYITNYGTVVVGEAILFFFTKYAFECVNEKKTTNKFILILIFVICIVDFLIQTIGAITGATFIIEDARFVAHALYDSTFITTAICLIIIKIYLVLNSKYIGKYLYKVFTLYYVLPVVTTIVLMINVGWSFLLQGVSLSLLIVYIGIEKQEKENLLTTLIDRDSLTNLFSRHAWNNKIEEIKNKTGKIGVVFADLNGLKFANDNFGHQAGDDLINKFSNILRTSFNNESIYRIGGDEFVVVVEKDINLFDAKIELLKNRILENDHIASLGKAVGETKDIINIIKTAESGMYKDKDAYYESSGKNRRKF